MHKFKSLYKQGVFASYRYFLFDYNLRKFEDQMYKSTQLTLMSCCIKTGA